MEASRRKDQLREREEEATEQKTLKYLEESFGSSDETEPDERNVPSPDGSFDEDEELDRADPM